MKLSVFCCFFFEFEAIQGVRVFLRDSFCHLFIFVINLCFNAAEIVHQATQIKLMRKHERQAMALAAKEAKRQQGIIQYHMYY